VPSVRFSFPVSDRPTSATLSAVISARFITGDRRRRRVPRIDSTRYSIERAQTNGCRSGASVGWARRAVILFRLRNWHRAARKLGDRSIIIATSVLWRTRPPVSSLRMRVPTALQLARKWIYRRRSPPHAVAEAMFCGMRRARECRMAMKEDRSRDRQTGCRVLDSGVFARNNSRGPRLSKWNAPAREAPREPWLWPVWRRSGRGQ